MSLAGSQGNDTSYDPRDIFIRELISNANDAIEKLRLTSLKDKSIWDGSNPLNITLKLVKPEGDQPGRIIISDTGIGMTPEELTTNLVRPRVSLFSNNH